MDNKIILTKSYRSITKEYKFKEYFPEIYIKIQSITFPADFSWSQKLYHYLNDDLDFKIGLCPICGNRCTYRNISLGYSKYCSYSCLNKSDEHKSKVKNTINSKYGCRDEFYKKRYDLSVRTCLKKYGVTNVSKLDDIKKKKEQTTLSHFGVKHTLNSPELYKQYESTCLNKYGYKNPSLSKEIIDKIRISKKNHNTTNTSSLEEYFCNYLKSNNIIFERQYKCERYPFLCDFYLPNCDTFIEIQGNWTHGFHPFNVSNKDDIRRLNYLKEKAKHSKYYLSAIKIWTIKDVEKRTTAQNNNIKLIEIFVNSLEELKNYIEKIKDELK